MGGFVLFMLHRVNTDRSGGEIGRRIINLLFVNKKHILELLKKVAEACFYILDNNNSILKAILLRVIERDKMS